MGRISSSFLKLLHNNKFVRPAADTDLLRMFQTGLVLRIWSGIFKMIMVITKSPLLPWHPSAGCSAAVSASGRHPHRPDPAPEDRRRRTYRYWAGWVHHSPGGSHSSETHPPPEKYGNWVCRPRPPFAYSAIRQLKSFVAASQPLWIASKLQAPIQRPQPRHLL